MRIIKLNRDMGRRGSTETASLDDPSSHEKNTSSSDRSASASVSEGERLSSTAEGARRKEPSSSVERGVSRERPGSAGEGQRISDREQDRSSGLARERERSGSDRDRSQGSDRDKDRVSGSGSQKASATSERDAEVERASRTERKNPNGASGGGRSVSLDKMTIGEKSAITRRLADHQEKPRASSKERGEGSERAVKSDR